MLKLIICDWNRTLFTDYYEETFFKGIFQKVFLRSLKNIQLLKAIRLLKTSKKIKDLFRLAKEGKNQEKLGCIKEILGLLNKNITQELHADFLESYAQDYADRAGNRLDRRILNPLRDIQEKYGIKLGIISSGYSKGIKYTLEKNGYKFDFIVANDFIIGSDKVVSFELKILDNKEGVLKEILLLNRMSSDEVMYIGDDLLDKNCLAMVRFPMVSFLASDENKKIFSEKANIFMPKSEEDMQAYLNMVIESNN